MRFLKTVQCVPRPGALPLRGAALAALFLAVALNAAAKDNLAILPFTGGAGEDGETIAELFSFDERLNAVFSPIPRTTITAAVGNEQNFQMSSGMTDADTIAAIGRQLGATYVVAGNITALGSNKLLVISILKIDDLRQIAGDFQTYTNIEELRGKLPLMAENIIAAVNASGADSLPKLAVVPVQARDDVDRRSADTLAQILAIHLIRGGNYAVYPRTSSLEQVQSEYSTQASSAAEENAVGIGHGVNPDLVLSVVARRLGSANMFNAAIINLVSGAQATGTSVDYQSMDDGIKAMESLAAALTGETADALGNAGEDGKDARPAGGGSRAAKNLGIGALNIIGGLGSFIEGDWPGGLTVLAGYAVAGALIGWELAIDPENPAYLVPGSIALGAAGAAIVYGFIRPFIYKRNKTVAALMDGMAITVVPGAEGQRVRLSYRFEM